MVVQDKPNMGSPLGRALAERPLLNCDRDYNNLETLRSDGLVVVKSSINSSTERPVLKQCCEAPDRGEYNRGSSIG